MEAYHRVSFKSAGFDHVAYLKTKGVSFNNCIDKVSFLLSSRLDIDQLIIESSTDKEHIADYNYLGLDFQVLKIKSVSYPYLKGLEFKAFNLFTSNYCDIK